MTPPMATARTRVFLLPIRSLHQLQRSYTPLLSLQHHPTFSTLSRHLRQPPTPQNLHNPFDPVSAHRHEAEQRAHYKKRTYLAAAGAALSVLATFAVVSLYDIPPSTVKNDAPASSPPYPESRITVVVGSGEQESDMVATGTSSVPLFPKSLTLPVAAAAMSKNAALPAGGAVDKEQQYQLLGLGIRTVSFLSIEVYVVGLYIAVSDIGTLQSRLVKQAAGVEGASALVGGEKAELARKLLDGEASEQVWDAVLADGGVRSVLRIVPTRNTDFGHLRDGWVRGMTAWANRRGWQDEGFGQAVAAFKGMFGGKGRKGVGKGRVLILEREQAGELAAWVEGEMGQEEERMVRLGRVVDERVGRAVWLGYLGGRKVASEGARKNIVEGLMEIVERPVGSVETKVV